MNHLNLKPMLNAYPDSMGGTLADIATVLEKEELKGAFSSFYILPSLFNTDLDRGFSVIDYGLDQTMAKRDDLQRLQNLGIDLKLDFILNHASVLSAPFQDILKKGEQSEYRDFFIDWNKFWEGHGEMTPGGYIQPDPELIRDMFFRKPGLPILMVRMPDGKDVPYWNTFYQEVRYCHVDALDLVGKTGMQYSAAKILEQRINDGLDAGLKPAQIDLTEAGAARDAVIGLLESGRKYLGQMDLNIKSPKVWEHYDNTLKTLASYGARIVRLDAFAYAPKEPGARNFLNEPGTWDLLEQVRKLADKYGVTLLPEIHASYGEKTHELVASKGYMIYDFFLPGLLIDALERRSGKLLANWAQELLDKKMWAVNMLGCHDGIPMLDLKGMLEDDQIQNLIDTIVARGGYIKNLHGQKNMYYQVNATYFSALGEDEKKMLMARAIQLFMPGKPQIWYLDLFGGRNDHEAVKRAGPGGHKEINRTNLSLDRIEKEMASPLFRNQVALLRLRNACKAFHPEASIQISCPADHLLEISWEYDGSRACLRADLSDFSFCVKADGFMMER